MNLVFLDINPRNFKLQFILEQAKLLYQVMRLLFPLQRTSKYNDNYGSRWQDTQSAAAPRVLEVRGFAWNKIITLRFIDVIYFLQCSAHYEVALYL